MMFKKVCFFIGFVTTALNCASYKPHVWEGFEYENGNSWEEPFFFIQMADCQFGMFDADRSWNKETALLEHAAEHINRLRPKFVILCGDLVNAGLGSKSRPGETAAYKAAIQKIDPSIPLICLCGNHDVGNIPTSYSILRYEADFGGPHYFSFWVGGVQGLVLNSSMISDPSKTKSLYNEQLAWFQDQLNIQVDDKPPVHRLVFTHHSWFLHSANDADGYYVIPKIRRMPFLNMMKAAGVRACFSGHYHRNAYGKYGEMEMVTTSALGKPFGKDPSGFRIVKVYQDRIVHNYYGLSKVPAHISL